MRVTHIVEQNGDGWLTVSALAGIAEALAAKCPPDADVMIRSADSQRDGKSWAVRVQWEEEP